MSGRYAIYYTPAADNPLTRLAEAWLGYSVWSGETVARAQTASLAPKQMVRFTEAPRRYGFHATLKPPMRLADGKTSEALMADISSYAETARPVLIDALVLRWIGPFLALVPDNQTPELDKLASKIVRQFEPYRAPLNPEEVARRLHKDLSARQVEMLNDWGYPYVHEEFRYHMTLTSPIEESDRSMVLAAAEQHFKAIAGRPLLIDQLVLCHEAEAGDPFVAIASHEFVRQTTTQTSRESAAI